MTAVERDTVSVVGPDAERYLQGQLSNDVSRLADGASAWTFLLEPSGKLGCFGRVRRQASDTFVLDLEPGQGDVAAARLRRFLIRTKVTLSTGSVLVELDDGSGPGEALIGWWGEGTHRIVTNGAVDPVATEARRVEAGWPGLPELAEGLIPGETGCVPVAVSFTKGCYTGQELVARVDSRGNHVPRLLRRIELTAASQPGAEIVAEDGTVVGTLTTVSGDRALGYVARRVEVPAAVTVAGVPASVVAQRADEPA